MLTHLLIKNYALIEQLEFVPSVQLNIITGETGAGKSIMLGAIGLLLGNRADYKALYNPEEKCVIEGHYDISGYYIQNIFEEEELDYESNTIIRREISPAGKSRAFVNDTPVTLETLRRITGELMDIHSQHDSHLLGSNEYQLQIIDTYSQNQALLAAYKQDFKQYKHHQEQLERLRAEAKEIRKEFDYNNYLLEELIKARLQPNEQDNLEHELNILENAEEVKQKLQVAHQLIFHDENAVLPLLQNVVSSMSSIAKYDPVYDDIRQRVQSCLIELKDIASEIGNEEENVAFDAERITTIQERLNLLYNLIHKHQSQDVAELIETRDNLQKKISKVQNLDENLVLAQQGVDTSLATLQKTAKKLSDSRLAVVSAIEEQVRNLLVELGIPNATLQVKHSAIQPTTGGIDLIEFLFSANKGMKPQLLKNVASGGEFSRLMMAIKYILADKRKLPTIIFDEIDTGVSGEIAIKMGNMMKDIARSHQVISITHLPQIAAQADAHFFVYKDHSAERTVSRMRKLTMEERVREIAQMIGGQNPTKGIVENVREMLSQVHTQSEL